MIFNEHMYESASKVRCQTWLVPVFRGATFRTGKLHVTFSPGHYVIRMVKVRTPPGKASSNLAHDALPAPPEQLSCMSVPTVFLVKWS